MKTLSVQQPYATYICAGIKTVENRTWNTDYRGKLLIHASGEAYVYPDMRCLPESWYTKILEFIDQRDWSEAKQGMLNFYDLIDDAYIFYGKEPAKEEPPEQWIEQAVEKYGAFMPSSALIGFCDLVDVVQDSKDDFAKQKQGMYHWILSEPYVFDKPILDVVGRRLLWDYKA